jgi:serine/threonine protein kinase
MLNIDFKGINFSFPNVVKGKYSLGRSLDKGGFGLVYECHDHENKQDCVIKIVSSIFNLII